MKQNLFAIIISLSLWGCVTSTSLHFDELKPASVTVDKRIAKVGMVSIAPLFREPAHAVVYANQTPFTVDSMWNDRFDLLVLKRFYSDLRDKNFYDSVWIDTTAYTLNKELTNKSLLYLLDSISYENNLQGIYFLSDVKYHTTLRLEPLYADQLWAYYEGSSATKLGFYNAVSGNFDDTALFTDSLFLEGVSGTINQIKDLLPTPKAFMAQMAYSVGHKAVKRYVPYWHQVSRTIYTGSNYLLQEGYKYAEIKDFSNAIRVWRYATEKGKPVEAARASINLAVMAEMQGDIESSLQWLNLSKQKYDLLKKYDDEKKHLERYKTELENRMVEVEKLRTQTMGGETK